MKKIIASALPVFCLSVLLQGCLTAMDSCCPPGSVTIDTPAEAPPPPSETGQESWAVGFSKFMKAQEKLKKETA